MSESKEYAAIIEIGNQINYFANAEFNKFFYFPFFSWIIGYIVRNILNECTKNIGIIKTNKALIGCLSQQPIPTYPY